MRLFDAFAGIGAFSFAAHKVGWHTVGFSEICPHASKVLRKHWPDVPNFGDVKDVDPLILRDFYGVDIITGGFPCQDLSICAKASRKDLEGARSGLFFTLADLITASGPDWFVLENVPRVLNYIDLIRRELHGYSIEGRIFEASAYGCLSRRKRAFIVGCSRTGGAKQVLDIAEDYGPLIQSRGSEDVLPMLLPWKGGCSLERLGSCLTFSKETDTYGVREMPGVPRRVDGHRYLMLGNSIAPVIPMLIFNAMREVDV